MRTILTIEHFDKDMRLLEKHEQLSQSYTLEFMRNLYPQFTQATYLGMPADSRNLRVISPSGYSPYPVNDTSGFYFYLQGQRYGIVVGEGTTAVSPTDVKLAIPIGHGTRFKGTPAQLSNSDFETGDFTDWTTSGSPTIVNGSFLGSRGEYYCDCSGNATRSISQAIDFTNIVAVSLNIYQYCLTAISRCKIYVDTDTLYTLDGSATLTFIYTLYLPLNYSGTHTLKIEYYSNDSHNRVSIDGIEIYGKELEYGGSELLETTFTSTDGEMTLRRYFTNHSGNNITVNETGVYAYPGRLILRDVLTSGVTLADGEVLRVSYTPQITV